MRISERMEQGVQVARSRVRERGNKGHVILKQEFVPELGRHSFIAVLIAADSGQERRRLLDADIEWVGPDTFALEGLQRIAAIHDKPEVMYDSGWLCVFKRPREPEPAERRSSFAREMQG